jgi:hypothetical protein
MRRRHAFSAACLLLALSGPALAQTAPAIQRASCVVRLQYDDDRFGPVPQTAQTLTALFTSTALVDPAVQAALSLTPEQAASVAQIDVQAAGESAVKLTVLVRPAATTPPDAAAKLLAELTRRAEVTFNGPTTRPDDRAASLAALIKQRAEVDARLAGLRAELANAGDAFNRREPATNLRPSLRQQIDEQSIELAVQQATLKSIEEQLPEIGADGAPDMAALRAKLIGLRIDARLAIAKADARVAQLRLRLDALDHDAATRPDRPAAVIQNEINELTMQRAQLDQQIAQLQNRRDGQPARPRLVVLDGGAR